jgi:hypothetical protein
LMNHHSLIHLTLDSSPTQERSSSHILNHKGIIWTPPPLFILGISSSHTTISWNYMGTRRTFISNI